MRNSLRTLYPSTIIANVRWANNEKYLKQHEINTLHCRPNVHYYSVRYVYSCVFTWSLAINVQDGKFTAQTPLPYLLWQLSFPNILALYFCSILTKVDTHLALMPIFHIYIIVLPYTYTYNLYLFRPCRPHRHNGKFPFPLFTLPYLSLPTYTLSFLPLFCIIS